MKLPDEQVEAILRTWPVACLATHRGNAPPHVVPVVFAWREGALWSPVDGKPKREGELARIRNLRRDSRASVLLQRYAADWSHLWWVRLDGVGEVVGAPDERDASVRQAEACLREKYPQYRNTPVFRGTPLLLRLRVERRSSWCAGEAVLEDLRDR